MEDASVLREETRSDDALEIIQSISLEHDSDASELFPLDSTEPSGCLHLARGQHEQHR